MKSFYKNYDECEYCQISYFERDTGYTEYECEFISDGRGCTGGDEECPLSFRYSIEE